MLAATTELRYWLRWPEADFDTQAAGLVLESAEMAVRAVPGVSRALDALEAQSASHTDTDLWRTAKLVVLEHASGMYTNPEGVMQRRIDQEGSVSFADSRHSARDLTKGQKARLQTAMRAAGLHSLELS